MFNGVPPTIRPKLFLFSWIANCVIGCSDLLMKSMSMVMVPLRRANVPLISRPLPLAAESQLALGAVKLEAPTEEVCMPMPLKMSARPPRFVGAVPVTGETFDSATGSEAGGPLI